MDGRQRDVSVARTFVEYRSLVDRERRRHVSHDSRRETRQSPSTGRSAAKKSAWVVTSELTQVDAIVVVGVHVVAPKFVRVVIVVPSECVLDAVENAGVAIGGLDVGSTAPNVADGPDPVSVVVEDGGSTVLVCEGWSCHRRRSWWSVGNYVEQAEESYLERRRAASTQPTRITIRTEKGWALSDSETSWIHTANPLRDERNKPRSARTTTTRGRTAV